MKLPPSEIKYIVLGLAVLILLMVVLSFIRRNKGAADFERRWKENQKLLAHKSTWQEAVIDADKMLDEVLRKKHFKGKTMGERLVAAQHHLTSNDMVWYSHKLRNKIVYEGLEVTKTDVKKGLMGFWRALKDLGAFSKDEE